MMWNYWQTPLKWCKCSVFNDLFIFPAWFCLLSVSKPSSDVIKRRCGRICIWICDVMLLQVMYPGTWKQTSSVFPQKPIITPNSEQQKINHCRGFASCLSHQTQKEVPIVFWGVEDRAFPHGVQGKTVKRSRRERKTREEIKIQDKQHKFDIGLSFVF